MLFIFKVSILPLFQKNVNLMWCIYLYHVLLVFEVILNGQPKINSLDVCRIIIYFGLEKQIIFHSERDVE